VSNNVAWSSDERRKLEGVNGDECEVRRPWRHSTGVERTSRFWPKFRYVRRPGLAGPLSRLLRYGSPLRGMLLASLALLALVAASSIASASFVAVGVAVTSASQDGVAWDTRPLPDNREIRGIHWSGKWVATGDDGLILFSTDAKNWTAAAGGGTTDWWEAEYGGGQWLVVGSDGAIASSVDGETWLPVCPGAVGCLPTSTCTTMGVCVSTQLTGLAYAAGRWVVVGAGNMGSGHILTSTNGGASWVAESWPRGVALRDVASDGTSFVAVGQTGTVARRTSTGEWQPLIVQSSLTSPAVWQLNAIAYGGGNWVAVGVDGTTITSPNGLAWTRQGTSQPGVVYSSVAWSGTQWMRVGPVASLWTSPGPPWSWTLTTLPAANAGLHDVWANGNDAVAVGGAGLLVRKASPTWIRERGPSGIGLNDVDHGLAAGEPGWLAVGIAQSVTSPDGLSWTPRQSPNLHAVTFTDALNDGQWIAVGDSGMVRYSQDAVSWTSIGPPGLAASLQDVAYDGNRYVAVGTGGTIITSPTGQPWTSRTIGGATLRAVVGDGALWVVGGDGGRILTSSDAVAWTPQTSPTARDIYGLAFDGRRFLAVATNPQGSSYDVIASEDGTNWSLLAQGTHRMFDITTDGQQWVMVGLSGTTVTPAGIILTSPDGATWTLRPSNTANQFLGVASSQKPPPVPPLVCKVPTFHPGQTRTLLATGGTGSYKWSAPGSANPGPATGSSFTTAYPGLGTYAVTLQSGTRTTTCLVNVVPWEPLACTGPATATRGLVATFVASGADDAAYAWRGGSPSILGQGETFQVSFDSAGRHEVQVASRGEVAACPVFVFDPDKVICVAPVQASTSEEVRLEALGGTGTYLWQAASGEPQVAVLDWRQPFRTTFNQPGVHIITVSSGAVTGACEVWVQQPCGMPSASFLPDAAVIRPGDTVTFRDTSTGIIAFWLWEFGDGQGAVEPNPRHRFMQEGRFAVRLTVYESGSGCTSTFQKDVVVGAQTEGASAGLDESVHFGQGGTLPAVADAGPDLVVPEGAQVRIFARGPTAWGHAWVQTAGPPQSLEGTFTPELRFAAPMLPTEAPILLGFRLSVSSGETSARDDVYVTVVSANHAPVADAGKDVVVRPGEDFILDGSGSMDPDGDSLSFRWRAVGDNPWTGSNLAGAVIAAPERPGVLVFELTVSDGRRSSVDTILVEVVTDATKAEGVEDSTGPNLTPNAVAASPSDGAWILWAALPVMALVALIVALAIVRWSKANDPARPMH
jgi:PKD repeat protein